MYCQKCGAENDNAARYCNSCGASFGKKRPKTAIIVIVILVVIVAIACMMMLKDNHEKETLHPVGVTVVAPGYSDAATRIPVNVTGKSASGQSVKKTCFIGADGRGIELARGEYELAFPASPFLPGARFYNVPQTSLKIVVDEKAQNDSPAVPANNEKAVFTEASIADITIEQIDDAARYAAEDPESAAKLPVLKEELVTERNRLVAEEEQRKASEALEAKYHISTQYYEFDIPEYWYDKVEWSTDAKGTTKVFPAGMPDNMLIEVSVVPQSDDEIGGDIGTGRIQARNASNGKRVEMWAANWPVRLFYAASSKTSSKVSPSEGEVLVDLGTGGSMTYASALASDPGMNGYRFYETMIAPTLVGK